MKRHALFLLLLCSFAGALSAGFSLGRPAAVKKRVSKLDDKVRAEQLAAGPANRAPVISAVTAVSTTVAAGGLAVISISAADSDGDTLSYHWTSSAGTFGVQGRNIKWQAPSVVGAYSLTCTVSDGKVQVSSSIAVGAVAPGTPRWVFPPGAAIVSSPAIGPDGTVYAAAAGGVLRAVSPGGASKWVFNTTGAEDIDFSPVVNSSGTVYVVGAGDIFGNNLYAIDPAGDAMWSPSAANVGLVVSRAPAIGIDGTIYVADETAFAVNAVDPATGVENSTFTALGSVPFAPVIGGDGTIYVVDGGDVLYAIDPVTGLSTSTQMSNSPLMPPVISSTGTIYVVDFGGQLISVDLVAGTETPYTTIGTISSAPVTGSTGTVYVVDDSDGRLHTIDPAAGIESPSPFSTLPLTFVPPAVGPDGTVYVVSGGVSLYAINPDGSIKWGPVSPAGGALITGDPVIGPDGMVYFGAADGRLYALYGTSGPL